jgi:hypothetical protein
MNPKIWNDLIQNDSKMKINKVFLCLLVLSAILFSCSTNQQDTVLLDSLVQTENGQVQGVVNESDDVVAFKGIPYAAPPRWRGTVFRALFCKNKNNVLHVQKKKSKCTPIYPKYT